jgi:radical SAM superfamily enzyme YgiQ (UPF0313 family)
MPSRLLLISANGCTTPDPVFPLGLAHLNAALRQAGHEIVWLDVLADIGRFAEALRQFRPGFVGISLRNIDDVLIRKQETFFNDLASLSGVIRRELNCPIILGGSGFSIFPERLLELAGADFGIAGEGESAFPALIKALEKGGDHQGIPGLVFRQGDRIIANAPAPGFLERGLADADRPGPVTAYYLQNGGMLNLQTQRGCARRCCYCTYPLIEGRQHRRRPPEVVAAEFEQLQRCGARYVFVVDSVFNSSARHVTEVCEALLESGVKLPWGCFLRPQGLTSGLMRLMAHAGLTHIEFGSDSFCDEVLAAYEKDLTFEDILRSSELAREEKVDFCHFLIAGGPGETMGTLERGFQNSLRLRGAVMMAVVGMRVYPGTGLFERAIAAGRIRRQSDLLAPVYYVEPGLTAEEIFAKLKEFSRRSPNWIAGDPDPGYLKMVSRLRQRGVTGPLWSYFSTIQRLWPQRGAWSGVGADFGSEASFNFRH